MYNASNTKEGGEVLTTIVVSHPSMTLILSILGRTSRGDCLRLGATPTTTPFVHSNATAREPFAAACMAYSICLMPPKGLKALTD